MKKILIVLVIVALLISLVVYLFGSNTNENTILNNSPSDATQPSEEVITQAPQANPNVKTFTMEEVSKHGPLTWDTGDSSLPCWMVIHGKVYEIPDSFTETHPGGHVIYDGCGTDATEFFETRPQGSGTPHSEKARAILEKYYIGELKN